MGKLEGKIALITGGTSGIGEAIARLFSKEGSTVVIVGRNKERGQKIVDTISIEDGKSFFVKCDVSIESEIISLKKWIDSEFGKLDVLVNNAGTLLLSNAEEIDEYKYDTVMNTNFKSVVFMTKHFLDLLVLNGGNIINNASIEGLQSNVSGKGTYLYSASKAAIVQYSQLCALNYSDRIRVNCICPGIIDTPIFTNRDFSRFDGKIPLGRMGVPEDVAKAALFLASEDASYITGAILKVDGAASLM